MALTATLALAVTFVVAGCSSTGSTSTGTVTAAPQASDAACTRVLAALPATVLGKARTPLQVAGAAAWGEPAIVLRCGLAALAPTTLPCLSVDDTDWVVDADHDPIVFGSFGRAPAVEVRVPASYGRDSAVAALTDVSAVSRLLPTDGHACVGPGDVTATSAPPASPSPSSSRSS
jgi:hypothetical protein